MTPIMTCIDLSSIKSDEICPRLLGAFRRRQRQRVVHAAATSSRGPRLAVQDTVGEIAMKTFRLAALAILLFAELSGFGSAVSAQTADSSTCWNVWRRGGQFSCPTCTAVEQMPLQTTITKCDANPNAGDPIGGFSMCGGAVSGPFSAAVARAGECGGATAGAAANTNDPFTCWNVWRRGAQFSCPTCTAVEQMPLQLTITSCDANPNAGDPIGGFSMCAVAFGPFSMATAKAAACGGTAATNFSGGSGAGAGSGSGSGSGGTGSGPPIIIQRINPGGNVDATPGVTGDTPNVSADPQSAAQGGMPELPKACKDAVAAIPAAAQARDDAGAQFQARAQQLIDAEKKRPSDPGTVMMAQVFVTQTVLALKNAQSRYQAALQKAKSLCPPQPDVPQQSAGDPNAPQAGQPVQGNSPALSKECEDAIAIVAAKAGERALANAAVSNAAKAVVNGRTESVATLYKLRATLSALTEVLASVDAEYQGALQFARDVCPPQPDVPQQSAGDPSAPNGPPPGQPDSPQQSASNSCPPNKGWLSCTAGNGGSFGSCQTPGDAAGIAYVNCALLENCRCTLDGKPVTPKIGGGGLLGGLTGPVTPPPDKPALPKPPPAPPATPVKTPPSPQPPSTSASCAKYTCTFWNIPVGTSPDLVQFNVCVPSGDWSHPSCTKEWWSRSRVNNDPNNPAPNDPAHPDGRDVQNACEMSKVGVTDYASFVKYCKSISLEPGKVTGPVPDTVHANVASLGTPQTDVAVGSGKPASQPTTDVAVGSDKPTSQPTTDVAVASPNTPKQPEPAPGPVAAAPGPMPSPGPSYPGDPPPGPQINIYVPPVVVRPGPLAPPGPATPPSMPGPDHGPQGKSAGPSNAPVNPPSPPHPDPPQAGGGARINSCAVENGQVVCGPPPSSKGPTAAPSPGPTQTNKPVVDTRAAPTTNKESLPPKPLAVQPVTPSASSSGTAKIAALPPTPVKPTGNASTAGKQPAALPPTPVQPSGNASAGGKKPEPLPVAPVAPTPAPPPLPQKQANVQPPPVQPSCRGEGTSFRPDQSESKTMQRTIVGGAACIHQLVDRGVMFTAVSIATAPRHGTFEKTGEYEYTYRPHPGYKGSDRYAIKICGQSDAGSGCSILTYDVAVE